MPTLTKSKKKAKAPVFRDAWIRAKVTDGMFSSEKVAMIFDYWEQKNVQILVPAESVKEVGDGNIH